eukprot:15193379-Alexandrium_andersonii.AAC.1
MCLSRSLPQRSPCCYPKQSALRESFPVYIKEWVNGHSPTPGACFSRLRSGPLLGTVSESSAPAPGAAHGSTVSEVRASGGGGGDEDRART